MRILPVGAIARTKFLKAHANGRAEDVDHCRTERRRAEDKLRVLSEKAFRRSRNRFQLPCLKNQAAPGPPAMRCVVQVDKYLNVA